VNDVRTVDQLERALRSGEPELLQPDRLTEIRTRGRRRQRGRLVAVVVGTAAVVVAATVGFAAVTGGPTDRTDDSPPIASKPHELSALAKRALAEIPGAVQVSSWQVVIPAPEDARATNGSEMDIPDDHVEFGPVDLGTRWYTGVTTFRQQDFPAWLYDGTSDYEQHVLGSPQDGYPVGSMDGGVIVDAGPMRLACVSPLREWGGDESDPCFPAMVSGPDGDLQYRWGMGTDDFLQPGSDLELFDTETYAGGTARTVWVGGADGTDVATVDLVATDGTTVSAHVETGTFVTGETIFWGTVDGQLAKAVTRDADGAVIEEHDVKPCSDPVDCEVR